MVNKALSIRQPWAFLIAAGIKDVENRSWPTKYRGRFFIHASKIYDKKAFIPSFVNLGQRIDMLLKAIINYDDKLPAGAVIGEASLVDCKYRFPDENDDLYSPWARSGMYGFIIKDPVLYKEPIPCKGKLKIFSLELEVNR